MSSSSNSGSSSFGMAGVIIVTIVFAVLKLTNTSPIATLDWLWVLAPLWIAALALVARFLLGLLVLVFVGGGAALYATRSTRPMRLTGKRPFGGTRPGGYRGLPNNEKAHNLGTYR